MPGCAGSHSGGPAKCDAPIREATDGRAGGGFFSDGGEWVLPEFDDYMLSRCPAPYSDSRVNVLGEPIRDDDRTGIGACAGPKAGDRVSCGPCASLGRDSHDIISDTTLHLL